MEAWRFITQNQFVFEEFEESTHSVQVHVVSHWSLITFDTELACSLMHRRERRREIEQQNETLNIAEERVQNM